MKDVQIEAVIRDEFAREGFPVLHIMDKPDFPEEEGRCWIASSADPSDKREIGGRLKNGGVAITISKLEFSLNEQFLDLLAARSKQAAKTLRALLVEQDAA